MEDNKQTQLSLDDHELLLRLASQQKAAAFQRRITVYIEILILILILAAILIINVVAKMKAQGVSLSQLIGRIEKYQNSGEINFRLEDKKGAMDAVRDYFMQTEKSTAYMDFDGYRVEFPDWWFNIRPSNTEPYLRFLCEATTKELLDEKVAKVREILTTQFDAK